MRNLSKSKLISFRQCPKRLWLEIHHPELRVNSAATQASFSVGNAVGEIAQQIYDPLKIGVTLDVQRDGYPVTFQRSMDWLATARPIFEGGYTAHQAFSFADVMLPEEINGRRVWRMVEVKSSTRVKDYHRDDAAIQSTIARHAGVPLSAITLAHIDSDFVYQGEGDYRGLLKEHDLTAEAFAREHEVVTWIDEAQQTAALAYEPVRTTGKHCSTPFECGFLLHCQAQEPQAEIPVSCLPGVASKALKQYIAAHLALELCDTPDDLLNKLQQRVKVHTLSGQVYFDAAGAADALKAYPLPAYFLDFETIQFAVPTWRGTSPYQQIPFQFSLHTLDESGTLAAQAFLDLSGGDPSRGFAEKLIAVCGNTGAIFVYNAGFEGARIKELAARFADLAVDLRAIKARLVDLHPVTKANYYHPSQRGSWSIKAVLPAVAPDLSYQDLDGVKDGGMAMEAYLEAIHPDTTAARKAEIETQLLAYCGLDTFAMVRLWQFLAGRNEFNFEADHG
jgi:Domain of unknown function(DUF2779)